MTGKLTAKVDEKAIDAIFATVNQCRLPGVAVGIAIDGVPAYRKGFGLASLELPLALTTSIRMRIGSTSKHFTSLVYLLLCEEGLASLEDPIGRHIPELHESARGVTARQLMAHTSGLRDVFDLVMQFNGYGRPIATEDLFDYYRTVDDVGFSPQTSWSYSNGGYLLLSMAIERITGQSLEDALRRRIFEPVGMYDTMLRRRDSDFVPNSATLHMMDAQGRYNREAMGLDLTGEGGIVSTVDDMLRWLRHMDHPVVGKPESWSALRHSQVLKNGTSTDYGLGLMFGRYRGAPVLFHGGGVFGGNSQMLKVPDAGLDVVVISNRQDVWAPMMAHRIVDAAVCGLDPVTEVPKLPKMRAHYLSPTSGRVVGLFTDGDMPILSVDGLDSPAHAVSSCSLGYAAPLDFYKLLVGFSGAKTPPESIELTDFGNSDRLDLIHPPSDLPVDELPGGTFRANSIGVEAIFHKSAEGSKLQFQGRLGKESYKLELLTPGIWRARSLAPIPLFGGIVTREPDGQGFRFSSSRTRNLRFRPV